MTTQTPAVVAAHIASTHRAVSAVTESLGIAVSALADSDAVSAEDAIRAAKAKLTAAAVAARRLTATVHRVQRPGKTSIEAQLLRNDPAGVVAELFVITAHWQDKSTKMHVPAHSPLAMDAIRLCWPAIRRKYNLPADAMIPEGCAAALCRAWDAHTAKHGHSGSCYVADAYAGTRGLRAALHR